MFRKIKSAFLYATLTGGFIAGLAYWADAANNWTGTNNTGTAITFCSFDTTGGGIQANCAVPTDIHGLPTTGATSFHLLSAATTNSTNVKNAAGLIIGIQVVNTTTTGVDLRLYNLVAAPTCSSATGVVKNIPIQPNTTSAGIVIPLPGGVYMSNGIGFCLTSSGGYTSDADNTAAVTGVTINIDYN